jgi:gas vesicle protein
MKEMPNKIERHTVEIVFALLSVVLILTTYLPVNLMMADASINLSQYDMKSVTDDINKSLSKLTGENSSDLLKDTIASINNTASQLANESKGIINENSLDTAEIIAGKIGIGIADVLSNISGEVKEGIESK